MSSPCGFGAIVRYSSMVSGPRWTLSFKFQKQHWSIPSEHQTNCTQLVMASRIVCMQFLKMTCQCRTMPYGVHVYMGALPVATEPLCELAQWRQDHCECRSWSSWPTVEIFQLVQLSMCEFFQRLQNTYMHHSHGCKTMRMYRTISNGVNANV